MGTENTKGTEAAGGSSGGDLAETLRALTEQLAALTARVAALEERAAPGTAADAVESAATSAAAAKPAAAAPAAAAVAAKPAAAGAANGGLDEETLLVISAAIAAFLGKKATIRQIRLVGSGTWARQGRVNIHASHAFARSGAAS